MNTHTNQDNLVPKSIVNYDNDHPEQSADIPLRPEIEMLIARYVTYLTQSREFTPIHVDEIASKLAKLYELVRKVIDWKDDHMLRRAATERILKRLLVTKIASIAPSNSVNPYKLAETVAMELIRGGHLPNDEVPKESVDVAAKALKKYLHMLEHAKETQLDPMLIKKKMGFSTFLVELASCEIEEILAQPVKENALLESMTKMMMDRIHIKPRNIMSDQEKQIHTFISVCRTLYDLDDTYITYRLLQLWYPRWEDNSDESLQTLSTHIGEYLLSINTYLTHPYAKQFFARSERVDTVFTLLGDLMEHYREEPHKLRPVFTNEQTFREHIGDFYDKRYKTLKRRLMRLAIFSSLSVFISNIFTFYIVEVPLAHLFAEGFNMWTALVDFTVPAIFMFILVAIIKPPDQNNRKKAIDLACSFTYAYGKKDLYEVELTKRQHFTFQTIFTSIYTVFGIAYFVLVAWVFSIAGLPVSSVIFDTMTIALNIFAAATIRNKSKELSVDERITIRDFLLDIWSLPVAKFGSFLANKWKEYNFVAVFFTFFIETPLVVIVEFIEQWSGFIKDRRAELH